MAEPPIAIPPPTLPNHPITETLILPVQAAAVASLAFPDASNSHLTPWRVRRYHDTADARYLIEAATRLRNTDVPVAFPTETVYGLGADATRSAAVRGIYAAKRRPADNPLIVHVSSLEQLRSILRPPGGGGDHPPPTNIHDDEEEDDPIPAIYRPLIQAFWPGPLTILLPNPPSSSLAPEVTAGLPTFGARMPASALALLLIQTAAVPIAAPSANASGKPSPTTARHVKDDLDGRIELILDGGPCGVGVESTVVDGLADPPAVLRPGGVSMAAIRACGAGWERTVRGYRDDGGGGGGGGAQEGGGEGDDDEPQPPPKAPGMKYRHYAPRARVELVARDGFWRSVVERIRRDPAGLRTVGLLRTGGVDDADRLPDDDDADADAGIANGHAHPTTSVGADGSSSNGGEIHASKAGTSSSSSSSPPAITESILTHPPAAAAAAAARSTTVLSLPLGRTVAQVARNLFAGLRDLDRRGVETIYVESIADDDEDDDDDGGGGGSAAAAVMNRLRKAAEGGGESVDVDVDVEGS